MKKIILKIHTDGTVTYGVQGVKGKACTKETDWLDKLLGRRTAFGAASLWNPCRSLR
jgi:hypothetical protein